MVHHYTCRCCVSLFAVILCLSWTASGATQRDLFAPSTKITFDLQSTHLIAEKLWGIFFEEVQWLTRLILAL